GGHGGLPCRSCPDTRAPPESHRTDAPTKKPTESMASACGSAGVWLRTVTVRTLSPCLNRREPVLPATRRGLQRPGLKATEELPPSPTRHAVTRCASSLNAGGSSIAARRNGARSRHEAGLDPLVVVACPATTGRRLVVPQHDGLPRGTRPVPTGAGSGRRSRPAPPRQRPVGPELVRGRHCPAPVRAVPGFAANQSRQSRCMGAGDQRGLRIGTQLGIATLAAPRDRARRQPLRRECDRVAELAECLPGRDDRRPHILSRAIAQATQDVTYEWRYAVLRRRD